MKADLDRERRALTVSLGATAALAVMGVVWGFFAGSQVILLDGAYALLGMALTWLSLVASRIAATVPTSRFPYGRETLVPLTIVLQGFALFATLTYAALEAVRVILDGGSEVATGSLLAYGIVSGLACIALSRFMLSADPDSDLLRAEARQWSASATFSVAVAVGALGAQGLDLVGLTSLRPYVDSILVLVGCAMLIPQPIILVRGALTELLEGAPSPEVQQPVAAALEAARTRHGLGEPLVRMTKVGRKLYVDATFLVEAKTWGVDDEDVVRSEVIAALGDLPYQVRLNLGLTTDPDWLG